MLAEYPNLELLDYIFKDCLKKVQVNRPYDIDVHVFPQIWPNTAGGFSAPGIMSGQAFIKQYTTVMLCGTFAIVFFGNQPAYMINNTNEEFKKDFDRRQMKSKYDAERLYREKEQEDGKEETTV